MGMSSGIVDMLRLTARIALGDNVSCRLDLAHVDLGEPILKRV